jgi:ADP-ribose pyrophosphatase YjhB (NUDIX family)
LPGGTFKIGEDTIQTLKREFKEETGFDVEPLNLLDVETSLFHHYKRGTEHYSILVFYLVKIAGESYQMLGSMMTSANTLSWLVG